MDVSIAMDLSYQDDFTVGQIEVEELLSITEKSTSNSYCQVCNNDSNSLTFLESISQESFNFTQKVSYENVYLMKLLLPMQLFRRQPMIPLSMIRLY